MKPEFVPATSKTAHFIVAASDIQTFINHLNGKGVYVDLPKHHFTQSGTEYFALEVQSGIPPQDGDLLVSTFQTPPK